MEITLRHNYEIREEELVRMGAIREEERVRMAQNSIIIFLMTNLIQEKGKYHPN